MSKQVGLLIFVLLLMIFTVPASQISSLQIEDELLSTNLTQASLSYSTMEGKTIWVPDNYTTIQEAINNATSGDTIFVKAGIYSENITVNKTVALIGEDKWATFIFSSWILVHANNTVIKNFTMQVEKGIDISPTFASFEPGNVTLTPPPTGNLIEENNIEAGWIEIPCISIASSVNNTIRNNNLHFRGASGIIASELQLTTMYGSVTGPPSSGNIIESNNMTSSGSSLGGWEPEGAIAIDEYSFNNTVRNNNVFLNLRSAGISLWGFENSIMGNKIVNGSTGIYVFGSGNIVSHNTLIDNFDGGILINTGGRNVFRNNSISGSRFNLFLWGGLSHDIDSSNAVDGKPVIWWVNETDRQVPLDAGFVALINCTNIRVENLTLANNSDGIILAYTTNSTIKGNTLSFNYRGICLYSSNNTRIFDNSVSCQMSVGLDLDNSCNNTIYHNTFYKNIWDASSDELENVWNNAYPSGGNYWTDYRGKDEKSGPNQDQPGSDGIGDTPYTRVCDRYPLMINRDYGQFSRSYHELNWSAEQLPSNVTAQQNGTEWVLYYNGTEKVTAILSTKFNYTSEYPYNFYYQFTWSAIPGFHARGISTAEYALELNLTTPVGNNHPVWNNTYPIWDQYWWVRGLYNQPISYHDLPRLYPTYPFDRTNKTNYSVHLSYWHLFYRLGYSLWDAEKMMHDLFTPPGEFTLKMYVTFKPILENATCTVRLTPLTLRAEREWVQVHPIQINDRTFNIITRSKAEGDVAPRIEVANIVLEQNILKFDVLSARVGGSDVIIPNELMWCLNSTDWKLRYTYYCYHSEGVRRPDAENGTHTFWNCWFGDYGGACHFEIQSTYVYPQHQFNVFDAGVWNETSCQIYVVSNSTVSNFQLNTDQKIISFNVTGDPPSLGFCKVTIPNIITQDMWQGNYTVLVDGKPPLEIINWTEGENTHIYFTYQHSEHEVIVVPEFSSFIIMPLSMTITLLTVILYKRKNAIKT